MKGSTSIRARLVILLTAGTLVLWIAAGVSSYVDARNELHELFDAQLAESAEMLLLQARHEMRESRDDDDRDGSPFEHAIDHPYAQQLHYQIRDSSGTVVYLSSPELPREPIVTGIASGFADRTLHGIRWRVVLLTDDRTGLQIQLCQRYDAREKVSAAIARNMLAPLAISVPILALLVLILTGSGLRPLRSFTAELRRRTPDNLEPVAVEDVPSELQPVAGALNGLLHRLRDRLEVERRFTADAAHELRTPLAALKTHAQVGLGATTDDERSRVFRQIVRSTDRMTHLVEQLLTLARVDPAGSVEQEPVDPASIVREVLAGNASNAALRDLGFIQQCETVPAVHGNRTLLSLLVRNLVENSMKHSREGGRIDVLLDADESSVLLAVEDDGPGIAVADRERVFDRFYRPAGSREQGSGLGLAIVRRIADLHGASIRFEDSPAGRFRTVVAIPREVRPRPA